MISSEKRQFYHLFNPSVYFLEMSKDSEMAMTFVGKSRGQYIAERFVPKKGEEETFVQYEMVHAGQAYIYPEDKQNCPNFDVLQKGQDQAKTAKLGVWSR